MDDLAVADTISRALCASTKKENGMGVKTSRLENAHSTTLSADLPYSHPYDWETILASFRAHQVPDLESVNDVEYIRIVQTRQGMGWLRVTKHAQKDALRLELWNGDQSDLEAVRSSVRRMFDLDADLGAIARAMENDPTLRSLWTRHPGLRVPRSWDGFESMVTTILGQLVSVSFGRTLTRELMDAAGKKVRHPKTGETMCLFPTAVQLLGADLSTIRTSEARRSAIRALASSVVDGTLNWKMPMDHDTLRKLLLSIAGIGPWTAEYVAMHGFHDDDAFPATDYGLKQQLKSYPQIRVNAVRPWRAYAAMLLWKDLSCSK
jgi:3-methyladenine DNA glycosylase/8-oxoguanine DNA glycosylase